jgi:threonine dehydrogenase-like Zn-dependent dehydrogenase
MKAVHYEGPFKVSVKEVELPKIEHPDDVIVKVTTAAICGSDLHMYQGRTAAENGLVFGHENSMFRPDWHARCLLMSDFRPS